jgi:hypothetical protein
MRVYIPSGDGEIANFFYSVVGKKGEREEIKEERRRRKGKRR